MRLAESRWALIVVAAAFLIVAATVLGGTSFPVSRGAGWDLSPDAIIIEAADLGGEVDGNCIPNARVWGDGQIVWVDGHWRGERRILQGWLSREELRALVDRFVDGGFFAIRRRLADRFSSGIVMTSLEVNLLEVQRTTHEPYLKLSPEIHELFDFVSEGAGASGTEFAPPTGYLTSYEAEDVGRAGQAASLTWPEERFGFRLDAATDGMWIDGDALAFAWKAVNEDRLMESDGAVYWTTVQVPGLSCIEP